MRGGVEEGLLGVIFCEDKTSLISGSSEIWSDKLKVLYNRHTESRRDGGNAQCHGGADGTKSDGGVAYRFLITILR